MLTFANLRIAFVSSSTRGAATMMVLISRPGLCCNYVTLGSCEVMFRNKSLASLCSLYLMCASSRQQPPGRNRRWSGKQINANIYQTCLNLEKSF